MLICVYLYIQDIWTLETKVRLLWPSRQKYKLWQSLEIKSWRMTHFIYCYYFKRTSPRGRNSDNDSSGTGPGKQKLTIQDNCWICPPGLHQTMNHIGSAVSLGPPPYFKLQLCYFCKFHKNINQYIKKDTVIGVLTTSLLNCCNTSSFENVQKHQPEQKWQLHFWTWEVICTGPELIAAASCLFLCSLWGGIFGLEGPNQHEPRISDRLPPTTTRSCSDFEIFSKATFICPITWWG